MSNEQQAPATLETVYETIIDWDENSRTRSRRGLARRIVGIYATPATPLRYLSDEEIMDCWKCQKPIQFARAVLAKAREKAPASKCNWTHNEEEGAWNTGCGHMFVLNDEGSPRAHGMKFCYSCGGLITQAREKV